MVLSTLLSMVTNNARERLTEHLMSPYWISDKIATSQTINREAHGKPVKEAVQGLWDHSTVPSGVMVVGEEAVVGKGRYKFSLDEEGFITGLCGYDMECYEGAKITWRASDGSGHSVTWTRRGSTPKRKRSLSAKQAEV